MYFTRRDDDRSIEKYVQNQKSSWKEKWEFFLHYGFKDDDHIWWKSFDYFKWMKISDEAMENFHLYRWYHVWKKEKETITFSTSTKHP